MSTGKTIALIKGIGGSTGSGLPSGVGPYKQMATDGDGNWVPVDRLAYTAMEEGESLGGSDGGFQWVENNGIYTSSAITRLSSDLVEGQTYCVMADGESMFSKAKKADGMVYLGNASFLGQMEDTGEPYLFLDGRNVGLGFVLAAKIEYKTFFILTAIETIHPIPAEYITGAPLTEADNGKVLGVVGGAIALVDALPAVSTDNNGQFLRVVNGAWEAATVPSGEGVSF